MSDKSKKEIDFSKLSNEELTKYAESKGFDPAESTTRNELLELLKHNTKDTHKIKETPQELKQEKKYIFFSIILILVVTLSLLIPILFSLNLL